MRILLLLFLSAITLSAFANQTRLWDRKPIDIEVPVSTSGASKELEVSFPTRISFGMTSALSGKLQVVNDNKTLYFTANRAFEPIHNVMVRTQDHKIILLTISASDRAKADSINIIYPKAVDTPSIAKSQLPTSKVGIEALLRYSIQQFYAPKRLLRAVPGITDAQRFNGKTYNLIPDGSLTAMPLVSFSGGARIITAVLVRNNLNIPVDVTPSMVCGHWIGFAPFPNSRLMPRGRHGDSTTLFLISHADFLSVYDGGCPHEDAI